MINCLNGIKNSHNIMIFKLKAVYYMVHKHENQQKDIKEEEEDPYKCVVENKLQMREWKRL